MSFTDRSWMYRFGRAANESAEFRAGVRTFLQFAKDNPMSLRDNGRIACPCTKCVNSRWEFEEVVGRHLMNRGFMPGYYTWWAQGERQGPAQTWASTSAPIHVEQNVGSNDLPNSEYQQYEQNSVGTAYEEFQNPQEVNVFDFPQQSETVQQGEIPNDVCREFLALLERQNVPVTDGSGKTILQLVSELLAGKVKHGLSQEAFNYFIEKMRESMNPVDAERIPKDYYETRKFFEGVRQEAIIFDVCVNDCIIYTDRWHALKKCPYCKERRFEVHEVGGVLRVSKTPRKRLWYFPIIPRLQRLFYCPKTARNMTWHLNCRDEDEEIIHPAGGAAWKKFDDDYPSFAIEPRNPRCAICTDGVNPFISKSNYSIWPVFITVYNLPPEMCMKQEFIFLTLLIQGPKGPGKNLDVMLRPLIQDLNTLWHEGVETYDVHTRQNFIMRAVLMWSITDYPGYGMASSWSTHGNLSCPYCMEFTRTIWLRFGRKFSFFDCHRQFLPCGHRFRRDRRNFTPGQTCNVVAPQRRDGESMYEEVLKLDPVIPGKSRKKNDVLPGFGVTHNWNQRSIFWELEYWPSHMVRHNLDVMHIEKNFFDNVFFTVVDDQSKTKDNLNARHDLEDLGFSDREELFPVQDENGKYHKPRAVYTVIKEDKKRIFEWLCTLKFPDGFASKIGNCFNPETLHVTGMKSHDCHVFLQRLLPVAFDMLPPHVWEPLAEISMFFRRLGAPRVRVSEMIQLERSIVETICKLEKIFPPSFFDSMEHLPIHLPYEARVCGPVQYRWMYPFERRMLSLKRDTKNKARPEGSICEAYLDLEVVNFCTMYFGDNADTYVTDRLSRNEIRLNPASGARPDIFERKGEAFGPKRLFRQLTAEEYKQAYLYILLNCGEVDNFVGQFDWQFCQGMNDHEIQQARAASFIDWFRVTVSQQPQGAIDRNLIDLARGPGREVRQHRGFKVNGFRFHTSSYGVTKGTTNSGVSVRGSTAAGGDAADFYGVLEDVVEIRFARNTIVLFKCHWYDTTSPQGVWKHPTCGLVEINPRRKYPYPEPFILASQASQVYYTTIPGQRRGNRRKNWRAVFNTRARHIIEGFSFVTVDDTTTSDDDDETIPNARGRIFQDTNLPALQLTGADDDDGIDEEGISLATGEFVEVIEEGCTDPTPAPTPANLLNSDSEEEFHESDSEDE